jgi:hypothetical protein
VPPANDSLPSSRAHRIILYALDWRGSSFSRHISIMICGFQTGSGDLVMRNDAQNARHFGAHDKPLCGNCGNRTFLARRSPVSDQALHLERQTFTCLGCNLDFERVVDADGEVVGCTELVRS